MELQNRSFKPGSKEVTERDGSRTTVRIYSGLQLKPEASPKDQEEAR